MTSGGGSFGVPVLPTSISMYQGASASGNLGNVTTSDNTYYTVVSRPQTGLGQYCGFETAFTLTQGPSQIENLSFQFEGSAVMGASAFVYLWNWNTSAWDVWKSFPLQPSDAIASVDLVPAGLTKYMNGANQMRMVVRAVSPLGRGGVMPPVFNFKTDHIYLNVLYRS